VPHPVDIHVGKSIRTRRWFIGKSQQDLAAGVGCTFQQIQKYESGANRVSASRLWDIAGALGVDVTYFFEGLRVPEASTLDEPVVPDLMKDKKAVDLVRAYYGIPKRQRVELFGLMKVLAVQKRLSA